MNSQMIFLIFSLCFFSVYSIDKFSFVMQANSESLFPILDKAPCYFIEQPTPVVSGGQILPIADFCQVVSQPNYELKFYNNVHDQTDERILMNQNHFLSVDDVLYIMSNNSLLRAFDMVFQDQEKDLMSNVLELNHLNEVYLDEETKLPAEFAQKNYVKLLYDEGNHAMIVVSSSIIFALSLDFDQKHSWLKPMKLEIPEGKPVIRADIFDELLYILRVDNEFEVWDLTILTEIRLVTKLNLLTEIGGSPSLNVSDFDVNDGFLALLDKASRKIMIFDATAIHTNFASHKVLNEVLDAPPLSLFLYNNKALILTGQLPKFPYTLEEFELFHDDECKLLRKTSLAGNPKDVVIGEVYVMLAFDDHIELFPHFYTDPIDTPHLLKYTLGISGVQDINLFEMIYESPKNESDYFAMMINGRVTVAKVREVPANMHCKPENVHPGIYYSDIVFLEVDCPFLTQYCNSSEVLRKHQLIEIEIEHSPGNLITTIYRSDSTKMLLLGVLCGLILGAGLTVLIAMVYIKAMKARYQKLLPETQPSREPINFPARIMSQDDLGTNPLKTQTTQGIDAANLSAAV